MTLRIRLFPLAFLALSACKGDQVDPVLPPPPGTGIITISISPTGVDLQVGSSLQMQATSSQIPSGQFTWMVSDTARVSISAAGLVLGKKVGAVAITACSTAYSTICGSATINIVAPPGP